MEAASQPGGQIDFPADQKRGGRCARSQGGEDWFRCVGQDH